ncbi:hypothetical protein [Bosea sp. AS-1]|uniref:hypothetical protein n=1 Tax=Bosea sp. AS-1 TaxID=2015316 RepID=UPI000B776CF2|nr:hypothetical protein [Bosea sp. AS-1]
MAVWALRCASADRIDLFEAQIVRRASGKVEVRGGNVRSPYTPDEVWIVKKGALDEIKGFAREIEAEMRTLPRADDINFAIARDGVSRDMTIRAMQFLKRLCVPGHHFVSGREG